MTASHVVVGVIVVDVGVIVVGVTDRVGMLRRDIAGKSVGRWWFPLGLHPVRRVVVKRRVIRRQILTSVV